MEKDGEWVTTNLYLNMERGLLYKVSSSDLNELRSCVGRSVKVEQFELDTIKLDDKDWYVIIGYRNGLAWIKKVVE